VLRRAPCMAEAASAGVRPARDGRVRQ